MVCKSKPHVQVVNDRLNLPHFIALIDRGIFIISLVYKMQNLEKSCFGHGFAEGRCLCQPMSRPKFSDTSLLPNNPLCNHQSQPCFLEYFKKFAQDRISLSSLVVGLHFAWLRRIVGAFHPASLLIFKSSASLSTALLTF